MPKAEAKSIGYSGCKEVTGSDGGVECIAISPARLGDLTVKSAKLRFAKRNLERVDYIQVTFAHTREQVAYALMKQYGKPALDTGKTWMWVQAGDDVIVMPKKQLLDASILYARYPGAERELKKAMDEQARKEQKLKNF